MSQNSFRFDLACTPDKIIAELKRITNNGSMDWIRPIIDLSFDAYASDYLSKNKPKFILYHPCLVEENLLEGSRLLDLCISRKHETLALESEAILTALDIQFAEQLADLEAKIAEPQWQISNKEAGGQPVVSSPVEKRKNLKEQGILTRNTLHSRDFSALNYGERVEHMRYLYSDTLRLCYERFYSAWIGLNRFFAIPTPIPPGPLSSDGKGTVEDLTKWLRTAIEKLEIGEKNERIEEFYFLASELSQFPDGVKQDFKNSGDFTIFLNEINPQTFGLPENDYTIRLLGLGLSVATTLPSSEYSKAAQELQNNPDTNIHLPFAFRFTTAQGMRELCSLTAHIEVPEQNWSQLHLDYLSPEQTYWKVPPLRIDGIQPWLRGNVKDAASISNISQIRNIDPAGQWLITIRDRVIISGKINNRKSLNFFPESEDLQKSLDLSLEDLIIGFRIAIRPRAL